MHQIKFLFFGILSIILVSCGSNSENSDGTESLLKKANGERYYGGILRINESEYIRNLFPHNITDAYSYRVASQIYEGLFKFNDKTLEVVPNLVESYDVDGSGTIYTFHLKDSVYFHDDKCFEEGKGRKLTAEDVKYSFTRLCTSNSNNQGFASIFKGVLKGADKYYEATKNGLTPDGGVEGIRIIDDLTIELTLVEPNSILTVHLARPACFIYPKEAEDLYGQDMRIKAVGTGPFYISDVDEEVAIILKKNKNYHQKDQFGNRLPLLDAVTIQFIKDKKSELFEFKKGNLDMIYRLPTEFIIEILEESEPGSNGEYSQFELQRSPEMATQFISFNTQSGIFRNNNVRKAFSFAIDRSKILDFVLNGEGFAPGNHGITPPVLVNYEIEKINGYSLNVDSARYYLGRAGYPEGKGFPKITFYFNAEGNRNTLVATEIQKQLKDHLNIDMDLELLPFAQLVEKAINGDYEIMRAAWLADYPSAENFLWIFQGKDVPRSAGQASYPNITRYNNTTFDRLFNRALYAGSIEEANRYFMQAENTLMNDAPMLVLWYDEGYRLLQSYVKNFPNNPMQYRDLGHVYFEKPEAL